MAFEVITRDVNFFAQLFGDRQIRALFWLTSFICAALIFVDLFGYNLICDGHPVMIVLGVWCVISGFLGTITQQLSIEQARRQRVAMRAETTPRLPRWSENSNNDAIQQKHCVQWIRISVECKVSWSQTQTVNAMKIFQRKLQNARKRSKITQKRKMQKNKLD